MAACHADRPSTGDPSAQLAQLLSSSAAGDRDAFSELHRLTAVRFHGLALRVVRDGARAEEVAQEAYLYIWLNSGRYDPRRGQALPWMSAIVHGRAIDAVRSAQASAVRDIAWGRRQCDTAFDVTADKVQATADARLVRAALDGLSEKQRTALDLAFFAGHTHIEVARRLDIPVGTAKARIRDGLRRMATSLG